MEPQSQQDRQPRERQHTAAPEVEAVPELPEQFAFLASVPAPLRPADLPVQLIFHTVHKNDVATLPKLTDSEGRVAFLREDVIENSRTLQRLFPSDYGRLDSSATGKISAVALGPKDMIWIRRAYELHKDKEAAYPADFAELLDRADARLKQLGKVDPILQVEGDVGAWQVAVRSDIGFQPPPSYEEQNYLFATDGKRVD